MVDLLGLLQQVGAALLDRLLLGGVVDDVVSDLLGLGMQRHDGFLQNVLLLLNVRFLQVHLL